VIHIIYFVKIIMEDTVEAQELKALEERALQLRALTIEEIGHLGVGHIGGAMSVIEVLTLLYFRRMQVDPGNPSWPERDKLVLSKGHAGPALYATLATKGFFPTEWLLTLNKGGTRLPSHCDRTKTPGIDMTTGSLGQGLSAACGLALANRMDKKASTIYCIIGDGESNEGQNWEAAMFAAHYKLDNLVAFTDYNHMQIDGTTREIMDLADPVSKWKAFGWNAELVPGHDMEAIDAAIGRAQARREAARASGSQAVPTMIVLDTVKAKGCSFCEGQVTSHNMNYTPAQTAEALAALGVEPALAARQAPAT
jgi:transketolase